MIDLNSLNIKNMQIKELENLANNLREVIIDIVSKNGGHLSSNLGVVELSIAMHYVFDIQKDPFIFDVSHQSYP
ncbi:1-deoxy-D-xylulose-5-phosphate synthase N-terminal domain-containing protein, partial [Campylobacter lari]